MQAKHDTFQLPRTLTSRPCPWRVLKYGIPRQPGNVHSQGYLPPFLLGSVNYRYHNTFPSKSQ